MSGTLVLVLWFLLAAAGIVVAGTYLARAGDVIAARTRLGGVWVGSVLVAAATSLPELGTDVAAVRRGAIDLALGDLFGSSMANMLIVAIISLLPAGRDIFRRAALDHALYAALAMIMTAAAATALLLETGAGIFRLGPGSLVLLAMYIAGSRAIARHSRVAAVAEAVPEMSRGAWDRAAVHEEVMSLRQAVTTFAIAAVAILFIAPMFASTAHQLADRTGMGETFVGTWLVGLTTSLPELVTSITAVRLGAFDLAIGNLFGSNAFNMVVFPALDLASTGGPVLALGSDAHLLSALLAMMLMAMAVAALIYRSEYKRRVVAPMSILMIVVYTLGLGLILRASVAG